MPFLKTLCLISPTLFKVHLNPAISEAIKLSANYKTCLSFKQARIKTLTRHSAIFFMKIGQRHFQAAPFATTRTSSAL